MVIIPPFLKEPVCSLLSTQEPNPELISFKVLSQNSSGDVEENHKNLIITVLRVYIQT
jgi:hypothetical protein